MKVEESIWKEWLSAENRTIKEVSAGRPKGILIEDVLEFLQEHLKLEQKESYYPEGSFNTVGYHEIYHEGSNGIRTAFASARMGIPTLSVGCTKEQWLELRQVLRDKGLFR